MDLKQLRKLSETNSLQGFQLYKKNILEVYLQNISAMESNKINELLEQYRSNNFRATTQYDHLLIEFLKAMKEYFLENYCDFQERTFKFLANV